MNQEKIGNLIKEIRKKNGLTQEKFASKYGVTYQAVSKWENGKNIPDINILKEICEDYHIDLNDLLEGNDSLKKKSKKKLYFILILILIVIGLIFFFYLNKNQDNDFQLKKISTTCDDFNLYGSIAYNSNKTSIYISNITYCGKADESLYQNIVCTLYEDDSITKTKISSYQYDDKDKPILLQKFLENIEFNVDHYSKTCKMYKENILYLEIEATDMEGQIIFYKIPLQLDENCNES